jgi:Domain of unknown function (DUF5123)/Domain of unknown function (DUF4957)
MNHINQNHQVGKAPFGTVRRSVLGAFLLLFFLYACKPEETVDPETRLFRPVLAKPLSATLNTVIVNMANMKAATKYSIEVSRDTFKTADYKFDVDTNLFVIDSKLLKGENLLWNTNYQIKATARAANATFDSKASDLGGVRTEKFPSILKAPTSADLLDAIVRVTWNVSGLPVTKIKVFAITDLKLAKSLAEYDVTAAEQKAGLKIISKLSPSTTYQIAIYSDAVLRGWENFTTIPSGVNLASPNVINLSESDNVNALQTAFTDAKEGSIIVLKKGNTYNAPVSATISKSVTITSAYGFGEQKAKILTTSNLIIADNSNIDYIRFIDVEVQGSDIAASYVFNPNQAGTVNIKELSFDNCVLNNMRGVLRIRNKTYITNYTIKNSIVHRIGNYGLLTADTDGAAGAAIENITFTNSTFSKINVFLTSRQNSKTVTISDCTLNELATNNGSLFTWRGAAGLNNVTDGITIKNSIFGPAWDEAKTKVLTVRGKSSGLASTGFTVLNTYATSDFAFVAGTEIGGFPSNTYAKTSDNLWVDAYNALNFNFKDATFAGRKDSGDPRWRVK